MEVALEKQAAADYYERRERQERELAQAAQSSTVRDIHDTLAERYARLAAEGQVRRTRQRATIVECQPR